MREKSSECRIHASHHVRAMTEMCSREPASAVLQHHPALTKTNGKNPSSPQQPQQTQPQSQPPTPRVASATAANNIGESRLLGQDDDSAGYNPTNPSQPGGRLKFFKDGKFILELSHRRDGDRTTWFPVPKKTFWPPSASVTPNRQESSASLSVSDDNSSIQSSPWQRDHCWKQTNPRRNISTEFSFYYRRNPKTRLCVHPRLLARKRRQPFDTSSSLAQLQESQRSKQQQKQQQQQQQSPQPPSQPPVIRKLNGAPSNKSLSIIIDKLARLLDPNVVSPRKRILRELERVTLEDQASKRRATPQQPTNSTVQTIEAPSTPASKQLSSYSITSILGEDKPSSESEPGFLRNLLKPQDRQQQQQQHPQHSPQHHPHSPRHQPQAQHSPRHQSPVQHSPRHQPHHSPQHQPVYHPRTSRLDPAMAAAAAAYLSPGATSSIHQPLYGLPMLPPAAYRAPPFCWMHYSQPVHYPPPMPLYSAPPQPPHHTPSPSPPAHRYKDYREQTLTPPSDMPLNLSKHAG